MRDEAVIKSSLPTNKRATPCLFKEIENLSSQQREFDKAVDTLDTSSYKILERLSIG